METKKLFGFQSHLVLSKRQFAKKLQEKHFQFVNIFQTGAALAAFKPPAETGVGTLAVLQEKHDQYLEKGRQVSTLLQEQIESSYLTRIPEADRLEGNPYILWVLVEHQLLTVRAEELKRSLSKFWDSLHPTWDQNHPEGRTIAKLDAFIDIWNDTRDFVTLVNTKNSFSSFTEPELANMQLS